MLLSLMGGGGAWTLDAGARISLPRPSMHSAPRPPSILDLEAAESFCTSEGIAASHLQTVFLHLFRRGGELSPDCLHEAGLPRVAARRLCDRFAVSTSRVVEEVESAGGRKLVVELASGQRVETVLIKHAHRSSGNRRCTVCVSSQVGCSRACTFCATGLMGQVAQLSAGEILEQVWHARASLAAEGGGFSVRNVVFMGMGEPLDNYDSVLGALRGLTHQCLFDLAAR